MEAINYFIHFFFLSFNCILLCLDSYKLRICRSTRTKSETTCLPVASRTRFHHDMLGAQMLFTTSLEACEHIGNLLRRQQDSNMCDMNLGWFHVGVDQQVEADSERIKSWNAVSRLQSKKTVLNFISKIIQFHFLLEDMSIVKNC